MGSSSKGGASSGVFQGFVIDPMLVNSPIIDLEQNIKSLLVKCILRTSKSDEVFGVIGDKYLSICSQYDSLSKKDNTILGNILHYNRGVLSHSREVVLTL